MNQEDLQDLKNWFANYVRSFESLDAEVQRNIDLKREHTWRVVQEIVHIGRCLGLKGEVLRLAEAMALLHDVGRFEQYVRYGTFADGRSENHAELGAAILLKCGILLPMEESSRKLILCSVRCHNRPSLPEGETGQCLFFLKLLRDADKLDIWKVVTDYYRRRSEERNEALELHLPDTPGASPDVVRFVRGGHPVDIRHVKNLNDLKVLQVGWIFDVHFQPTMDRIRDRRYMEMIQGALPGTREMNELFDRVYAFQRTYAGFSRSDVPLPTWVT